MNYLTKLSHPERFRWRPYCTGLTDNTTQTARVVIAGAGLVGNSVAYHLTENGWNNVVVLDQNRIGSGTSDFGSGTIGLFKPTPERNIIMESVKLYERLQHAGHNVGLQKCGSLNLAQTHDRVIAFKRRIAYNIPTGLFCEFIDAETAKQLHPLLNVDDIQGAVHVPDDCVANPALVLKVLVSLSKQKGVKYFEGCEVKWVIIQNLYRKIYFLNYFIPLAGKHKRGSY